MDGEYFTVLLVCQYELCTSETAKVFVDAGVLKDSEWFMVFAGNRQFAFVRLGNAMNLEAGLVLSPLFILGSLHPMELNLVYTHIKDLQARVEALRGYL